MQVEHADYLWDDATAPSDEVDLLVYRSNLLGADLRITNYAGGNTSVKVDEVDPFTGETVRVMYVKASGGDLGTMTRDKLACVRMDRMLSLEKIYRGRDHEDDMVAYYFDAAWKRNANAPSIDTPLHAYLPFAHVDHMHPDAGIALCTAVDGPRIVENLFDGTAGWVEFQRPGFDLALKLRDAVRANPNLRAIFLGGHGLINWAGTAKACYENTLELIERCAQYLEDHRPRVVFGGVRIPPLDPAQRRRQQARIMPILRGLTSSERRTIATVRDDDAVLEFVGSADAARLAAVGTSCPDHFLRTKRLPMLVELEPDADPAERREGLERAFAAYGEAERAYYDRNAHRTQVPFRTPNPAIILWPGVGMFAYAKDKQTSRVSAEFFVNAINVMRGSEAVSRYTGLSEQDAFDIEYWALEEAKLRRLPAEKPLSRRVAFVTGAAGGIGSAITRRLAAEGACVVAADLDLPGVQKLADELGETVVGIELDITQESSVRDAFVAGALAFGGIDLVVNNAGITLSSSIQDTTVEDYEKVHRVVDLGSFLVTREAARQFEAQGLDGDIVYIVSKNAVASGAANVAYGSSKAAQLHQMRLAAVDLAPLGVRVNAVNPDAVVRGSKLFAGVWGEERSKTYGVAREELGAYYAQRSLLKREILPRDVASAVFVLVGGDLPKTTGAVIPVDGGLPMAFPR